MLAAALGGRRRVVQYHWGGGTPTYLSLEQIARLDTIVQRYFDLAPDAERAIEIDPRVTTRQQITLLRRLGFNRLSFGVQDFAAAVQQAIQRNQTEAETRDLYWAAREAGFDSINFDLVYGLPKQTVQSFEHTLQGVIDMLPDRIAVYSYAHVPWLRPNQKAIDPLGLPNPQVKRQLLGSALEILTAAGYESIGMDHFALPDDDLAVAAREGRLHRNFMGYTTRPATDSVAVGVSAIGDVAGAFSQNHKTLARYYEAIDAGRFPVERGYALTDDDRLRRFVITELMCNFQVDRDDVRDRFGVDMPEYFAAELDALGADRWPTGCSKRPPRRSASRRAAASSSGISAWPSIGTWARTRDGRSFPAPFESPHEPPRHGTHGRPAVQPRRTRRSRVGRAVSRQSLF
jgi:oxygen-independent coproporphyrinogen-3 oxidase